MPFVIPMVGANPDRRTSNQEFDLGTSQMDTDNRTWVYVQAPAAVAAAAVVILTTPAFTIATGAGNYTADTAFAAGEYGWVRKTTSPL